MIQKYRECFRNFLHKINWLPPLAARICLGLVFAESGWGKLQHLDKVTEYFVSLGVPFAAVQAPFVASCELVFGVFVLFGFLTRISSVPLSIIMVVALITAKLEEIDSLSSLFGISEFLYILLFLYLIVVGAGAISIDRFWCSRCSKDQKS